MKTYIQEHTEVISALATAAAVYCAVCNFI